MLVLLFVAFLGVKVVMVWGIGCVFWLVVRFLGRQGRPRGGAYIFFLFCHAGGFGACGATCFDEHDSVLSEDCPTNRVPLLVGLTTIASSSMTVGGADGGLWEIKSM